LQSTVLETGCKFRRDDVRRRVEELQAAQALKYPRIKNDKNAKTCAEFTSKYNFLMPGESKEGELVTLRGMTPDI
jgi:hypothetical protein